MYDPEMRKDCPMRGTLGNCSPVGGFCVNAVSDEICEAVHNAYQHGYGHAIAMLKEQEAVVPIEKDEVVVKTRYRFDCPCGAPLLVNQPYCAGCGKRVKWNEMR